MDLTEPISKTPYNYYGITLNNSRVLRFVGKQAPSILRLQLMGWGMSEIERLIRSMNSFLKNQDVVFELLDDLQYLLFVSTSSFTGNFHYGIE
mgnify:CR=1 FL=1